MLKKYKNGFIEIIQRNNLDPRQFEAKESKDGIYESFTLQFRGSPFKFVTRSNDTNFHSFDCASTEFKPRFPMGGHTLGWQNIQFIHTKFETWLTNELNVYLEEQTSPDLWEQINSQESLFPSPLSDEQDFSDFSEEEKTQLRLALSEFRLQIAETFKPTEEQMKIIDARIGYASDALDRLNRFDWKSILISTALSISVALSLDTTRGKLLFELLKKVFSNVVYLMQ